MASVVAGGLFNALAFSASGFLFSKLNHPGYDAEMKRHNRALEELARSKEKWYEQDANADINSTNQSLDRLRLVLARENVSYTQHLNSEPKLADFYTPSLKMAEYQTIVVGLMGLGLGYLIYKLV